MTQQFTTRLTQLSAAMADTGVLGIQRGIEREALRICEQGKLAPNGHPKALGAALTHPLITTDYAETLLEFITPVSDSVEQVLSRLTDIHHETMKQLDGQRLWPLSMPCYIGDEEDIVLADYGQSNIGKMKHAYRQGLRHRYGSAMQVISGVHYNFSLPMSFWQNLQKVEGDQQDIAEFISQRYMGLIRNFYRYGWMVAYLYGASPALCGSFMNAGDSELAFETMGKGTLYLPYATSLRLSDLGYTSSAQHQLDINYNSVSEYVKSVRKAVSTHSDEFANIGVKVEGEYRQLNANILQIENELYAPIRAKRVAKPGQTPSQALAEDGIEYIEIRALDVNPFSGVGVTESQVRVIDSLLLACVLMDSPEMDQNELQQSRDNFNTVAIQGRNPALEMTIAGQTQGLPKHIEQLLEQMSKAAELLDVQREAPDFSNALEEVIADISNDNTYSSRFLRLLKAQAQDNSGLGLQWAAQYREEMLGHTSINWQDQDFSAMAEQSFIEQQAIEAGDDLDFDDFLVKYFENANR
ncbi:MULTISPECIES: glutamate--cysteine ligase [unclassified Agarivorans]|uniref:glutamate--cysteine ligase n=1 Tax=unclassified Agarivorans TaxID=2636026 RepID=UPI0026E40CCD|nr:MULTISPECIES: glutamate--cysteine ligase [unclassified Agarivorans]MDO6687679.1 glutamate--cysteine ligase [Agarivorans sp. 3_MG-2023]MDO6717233.1 glutamate--cysteine ligase [Agarivorans sp. 2_MG-2023]